MVQGFQTIVADRGSTRGAQKDPGMAMCDLFMFELPTFELAACHAAAGNSTHVYEFDFVGSPDSRFGVRLETFFLSFRRDGPFKN